MEKKFSKTILNAALGVVGAIYLINPTAGLIEIIPDNIPIIGNLDEAAAALLVLGALRYFGIDLMGWMGKKNKIQKVDQTR